MVRGKGRDAAGRRGIAVTPRVEEIERLLASCTVEERHAIFERLREEFPIHSIEETLAAQAEIILEAINRSDDLSIRGIRGLIAQAAFAIDVIAQMPGWRDVTQGENLPYDFLLEDARGPVRVQVKMQRQKEHRPMTAREGYRRFSETMYVTETQRTRGGRSPSGEDTRPYRFGDFDILAVCLQPSTGKWDDFMYTVERWLLPRDEDPRLLLKFQPVPMRPNGDWTDDFGMCVEWFRSGVEKRIGVDEGTAESG
jgi:hypothetical protein